MRSTPIISATCSMALVDIGTICKNKGQNKGQNKGVAREKEIETEMDIDMETEIEIEIEIEAYGYHTISLRSIVFRHFRLARNDTRVIHLDNKKRQSL